MALLLALLLLAAVVAVVAAPLRRRDRLDDAPGPDAAEVEAIRQAKLREILDTDLDYRTGKLDEGDYRELDSALRAEAIALLGDDAPER